MSTFLELSSCTSISGRRHKNSRYLYVGRRIYSLYKIHCMAHKHLLYIRWANCQNICNFVNESAGGKGCRREMNESLLASGLSGFFCLRKNIPLVTSSDSCFSASVTLSKDHC